MQSAICSANTSFLLAGLLETYVDGHLLFLFYGESPGDLGVDDFEHFVETGGC